MRPETAAIGNAWDYDAEWGSASIRGYRRDPSDKKLLSFYFLYVDDRVRASFFASYRKNNRFRLNWLTR